MHMYIYIYIYVWVYNKNKLMNTYILFIYLFFKKGGLEGFILGQTSVFMIQPKDLFGNFNGNIKSSKDFIVKVTSAVSSQNIPTTYVVQADGSLLVSYNTSIEEGLYIDVQYKEKPVSGIVRSVTKTSPFFVPLREVTKMFVPSSILQISVLSACGVNFILLLLISMYLFYFKRTENIVKFSQPRMMMMMMIGQCSLVIGIAGLSLYPSPEICAAQIIFGHVGFSLIFGGLFAKTWRVLIIYQSTLKLKKVNVPDYVLWGIIGKILKSIILK